MKRCFILSLLVTASSMLYAGNADRVGETGAYELLINGWARSSGFHGMNTARVHGIEAMRINAGGLALTRKTEIAAAYSSWFSGSEMDVIMGGFAQRFKDENVIAISLMSLNTGDIEVTTVQNPEGGLGTFKPSFINIGIGYARQFSNSISGGVVFRLVSESIADINAFGFALDMGLQYVTGPKDNVHFGVAVRNLGTPMKFGGDGFAFRGEAPNGNYEQTLLQRSQGFELPSLLHIGAAYDIYVGPTTSKDEEAKNDHRITIVANFTSNSVGKDHFGGGLEYSFKELFMVRGGYRWEDGITGADTRTRVESGFAAGATFDVPIGKNTDLGIDYSYRTTEVFNGTHSVGLRLNL